MQVPQGMPCYFSMEHLVHTRAQLGYLPNATYLPHITNHLNHAGLAYLHHTISTVE